MGMRVRESLRRQRRAGLIGIGFVACALVASTCSSPQSDEVRSAGSGTTTTAVAQTASDQPPVPVQYGWGSHQPPAMQWPVQYGVTTTPLTPQRRALFASQLEKVRAVGLSIGTVAQAEKLGFVKNWQRVDGRGFEYVNWGWWSHSVDLDHPTTLAFEGDQPDSRIVSVAYNVLGSQDDGPPTTFPLEIVPWHYHYNLCRRADGAIVASGEPERCARMGGTERPELDNWMVDLWVIPGWENPWGLVSSKHPDLFDPPQAWFDPRQTEAANHYASVSTSKTADFDYRIPKGTNAKIEAHEPVNVLPGAIHAKVGQTLRISNDDDEGVAVGPFWIQPHRSIAMKFSSNGQIDAECQLHPSGKFIVYIGT